MKVFVNNFTCVRDIFGISSGYLPISPCQGVFKEVYVISTGVGNSRYGAVEGRGRGVGWASKK